MNWLTSCTAYGPGMPTRSACISHGDRIVAGLLGLEHGGISVETVGELETKDASRTRLRWYCGLALMSELGVARLEGVTG